MAQGGVRLLRFQLNWSEIQPQPSGPYDWTEADKQVAGAAAAGITLVPFFYGTAAWAANCAGATPTQPGNPISVPQSGDLCTRVLPTSPTAEAGWSAFLAAAVARYGPAGTFWTDPTDAYTPPYLPIRIWQIWNEPNSVEFAPPRPSAAAYARLLQISHETIKGSDPGAKLVLGGLFRPTRKFLDKLYKRGAKQLFDVMAVHPYAADIKFLTSQLEVTRDAMKRHRDGKTPIWITELGWGSAAPTLVPLPLRRLLLGINGQARMLRRSYRFLIAKRKRFHLGAILWFSWKDVPAGTGGRCYLCESAGLFSADGSPKPAWSAFARAAGGVP